MVFGWMWPLLVIVVIVAVALVVQDRGRGDDSRAAEEALARRYADGEIDEDEYRTRSATLTAVRPRHGARSSWWWPLAIAIGAIVVLIVGLLWGDMGSGWMWDTAGRHMGWTPCPVTQRPACAGTLTVR